MLFVLLQLVLSCFFIIALYYHWFVCLLLLWHCFCCNSHYVSAACCLGFSLFSVGKYDCLHVEVVGCLGWIFGICMDWQLVLLLPGCGLIHLLLL